jgi:hypothetical protein
LAAGDQGGNDAAQSFLFSKQTGLVKLKLYNLIGKAGQTTAAAQAGEESPGSIEQDAG